MTSGTGRGRFPRRLYDIGEEPDPRFSLANERTFLAWIRTALAFLAAGVSVEAFPLQISSLLRTVGASVFLCVGVFAVVYAWVGWWRAERALRSATPLPGMGRGLILASGLLLGTALLIAALVL